MNQANDEKSILDELLVDDSKSKKKKNGFVQTIQITPNNEIWKNLDINTHKTDNIGNKSKNTIKSRGTKHIMKPDQDITQTVQPAQTTEDEVSTQTSEDKASTQTTENKSNTAKNKRENRETANNTVEISSDSTIIRKSKQKPKIKKRESIIKDFDSDVISHDELGELIREVTLRIFNEGSSELNYLIISSLNTPSTLDDISKKINHTPARVIACLRKLEDTGLVELNDNDDTYTTTNLTRSFIELVTEFGNRAKPIVINGLRDRNIHIKNK